MDSRGFWDESSDENEDDENQEPFHASKDGVIFLVDCSETMFPKNDNDENHFKTCMKAVQITLQNKIIQRETDLVGVVLFGTEKTENAVDFKHIYVYQKLGRPNAERILKIEELIGMSWKNFNNKFGSNSDYQIGDALWACSDLFSKCEEKLGSKRVILFTNNDKPHEGKAANDAKIRAEDLHKNGISLELINLPAPDQSFDVDEFYKDLLFPDEDEMTDLPCPSARLEELLIRVRSKDHKKRPMRRITFSLGKGVEMAVGVYLLISQCRKPYSTKLYKKNNEELKIKRKTYLKETGKVLFPQDFKYSLNYGGKKIIFDKEEIAGIKSFGTAGLTLMGFKQRSKLKTYQHVKPAQFIYPDEKTIAGSTCLFTALLNRCLHHDVVVICKYIQSKSSPPCFVALVPQKEILNEQKVQTSPSGFHVIFLPFADDFRKIDLGVTPKALPEQKEKAQELIKNLKFTFSPDKFENPDIQEHWRNIEALALERTEREEFVDYAIPDKEQMAQRAGTFAEQLQALIYPKDYKPNLKRKRTDGHEIKNKVPCHENADLKTLAENDKLKGMKVADLKQLMKENDVKVIGTKKQELIDAIHKHYQL